MIQLFLYLGEETQYNIYNVVLSVLLAMKTINRLFEKKKIEIYNFIYYYIFYITSLPMKAKFITYIKSNDFCALKNDFKELNECYDVKELSYEHYDPTNDLIKFACQCGNLECLAVLFEYNITPLYYWNKIGSDFIDPLNVEQVLDICPYNYRQQLFTYGLQVGNITIIQKFIEMSAHNQFQFPRKKFYEALMYCLQSQNSMEKRIISIMINFISLWILNDDINTTQKCYVCSNMVSLRFHRFVSIMNSLG